MMRRFSNRGGGDDESSIDSEGPMSQLFANTDSDVDKSSENLGPI